MVVVVVVAVFIETREAGEASSEGEKAEGCRASEQHQVQGFQ